MQLCGQQFRRTILKHNYPKNRKSRECATQILLNTVGEEKLHDLWQEHGMFKSADILADQLGWCVTGYVMRYLSNKFNWTRVISDKSLPIYIGILNGKVPKEYYKHIKFE